MTDVEVGSFDMCCSSRFRVRLTLWRFVYKHIFSHKLIIMLFSYPLFDSNHTHQLTLGNNLSTEYQYTVFIHVNTSSQIQIDAFCWCTQWKELRIFVSNLCEDDWPLRTRPSIFYLFPWLRPVSLQLKAGMYGSIRRYYCHLLLWSPERTFVNHTQLFLFRETLIISIDGHVLLNCQNFHLSKTIISSI